MRMDQKKRERRKVDMACIHAITSAWSHVIGVTLGVKSEAHPCSQMRSILAVIPMYTASMAVQSCHRCCLFSNANIRNNFGCCLFSAAVSVRLFLVRQPTSPSSSAKPLAWLSASPSCTTDVYLNNQHVLPALLV